jgi:hypothetical protein
MSTEVAVREPSLVDLMQQIVSMPASEGLDRVAMLERIVALKERADEQERRNQFAAAMAALQAELPQIDKRGKIMNKEGTAVRSRYALIEEMDVQIRPYLATHGFCFSYDTKPADKPNEIRILGTMTHRMGHSETKQIDMPVETGAMSDQQKRASTLSHGIRAILKMHLNLVMRGVDDDTQGNPELITAKDLAVIKELIASTGADEVKFLLFLKVENFEEIQRRDVPKAMALLRAKQAGKNGTR